MQNPQAPSVARDEKTQCLCMTLNLVNMICLGFLLKLDLYKYVMVSRHIFLEIQVKIHTSGITAAIPRVGIAEI